MSRNRKPAPTDPPAGGPAPATPGEPLEPQLLGYVAWLMERDRPGAVLALRDWLRLHEPLRTMLAVRVAAEHGLVELLPQLRRLREEVRSRAVLEPAFLADIDRAIEVLSSG
ncbi:MAG TPA: hypothetical protein VFQ38_19795 [Longimicrobiales bacterium]|nr:hypothetical protein [Longimicrobiales bacterium]